MLAFVWLSVMAVTLLIVAQVSPVVPFVYKTLSPAPTLCVGPNAVSHNLILQSVANFRELAQLAMELKPEWTSAKTLHAHKYYRAFQTIRVDRAVPNAEAMLALCAFMAKPGAEVLVGDERVPLPVSESCVTQILAGILAPHLGEDDRVRDWYPTSLAREAEVRKAYESDKGYTVTTPTSAIHGLVLKAMFPRIQITHKVEWLTQFI